MRRHARHAFVLALALGALAAAGCGNAPPAVTTTTAPADSTTSAATQPLAPPGATSAAATTGATDATDAPRTVKLDPPNGATNVDATRATLSVTFDRPMDRDGWAYVVESKATAPDIGESTWDFGATTNTAQVKLEPGRTYVVWLNSASYAYFRDLQGHLLPPLRWTFTTAPATAAKPSAADVGTVSSHAAQPPSPGGR